MISKNYQDDVHSVREALTLLNALIEDKELHFSKDEIKSVFHHMKNASQRLNKISSALA